MGWHLVSGQVVTQGSQAGAAPDCHAGEALLRAAAEAVAHVEDDASLVILAPVALVAERHGLDGADLQPAQGAPVNPESKL